MLKYTVSANTKESQELHLNQDECEGVCSRLDGYQSSASTSPTASQCGCLDKHRTVISVGGSSDEDDDDTSHTSCRSSATSGYSIPKPCLDSTNDNDAIDSNEWGYLRVFTTHVSGDAKYKTVKITNSSTTEEVISRIVSKFRPCPTREALDRYELWMEVQTRHGGADYSTSWLKLDNSATPLRLQQCHPHGLSRFVLLFSPRTSG